MRTLLFLINLLVILFQPLNAKSQTVLTPAERETAIKKITKKLKKSGYAFNETFQDIDQRISTKKELIDASKTVKEFVEAINTVFDTYDLSHFWIWTPQEINDRRRNTSLGIGAALTKIDEGYFVSRITDGGVAYKAGIRPGDVLKLIDEKNITSTSQLKSQPNTKRKLEFCRNGSVSTTELRFFSHPPFSKDSLYFINDHTAVITVNTFRSNVYDRKLIEGLFQDAKNARRIILDLRSNGGGYSGHVQHLLSMIIPADVNCQYFVHREDHDKFFRKYNRNPESLSELTDFAGRKFKPLKLSKDVSAYTGEIMVLIDERSGSGADVFPTAVQDCKRGIVAGNTSAGKVLAGDQFKLPAGMVLFYPTGESIRLNGVRLEGNGCVPDLSYSREETAKNDFIMPLLTNYQFQNQ